MAFGYLSDAYDGRALSVPDRPFYGIEIIPSQTGVSDDGSLDVEQFLCEYHSRLYRFVFCIVGSNEYFRCDCGYIDFTWVIFVGSQQMAYQENARGEIV